MGIEENKFVSDEDLEEQRLYIDKIKQYNSIFEQRHNRMPLCFTHTYGCQQNENDTEQINGMLIEMGYNFTENKNEADFILFNTCAVREHAELKVFGTVGALLHLKEEKPSLKIALCGCMVSQKHIETDIKRKYRQVDLVFGTNALYRFPENMYKVLTGEQRIFDTDEENALIAENLPIRRTDKLKAGVSIMSGCNNYCSYCVVPYVRGRERSRTKESVLKQVEGLINSGYKEITLLGQNVNSYHKDLSENYDFSDLLSDINDFDGDFSIKFMTSHPKDASKKLFDTIARCEKVSKHIHLPFQSGSNIILAKMNRNYTIEQYLELIKYAKSVISDITFTSDVIVGFPSETDSDFEKTIDLIKKVNFCKLYTFIYSKRRGTPAAEMDQQVDKEVKKQRFSRLLDIQSKCSENLHRQYINKILEVFVEDISESDDTLFTGHSNNNIIVQINPCGIPIKIGERIKVKITKTMSWALYGDYKIEGDIK